MAVKRKIRFNGEEPNRCFSVMSHKLPDTVAKELPGFSIVSSIADEADMDKHRLCSIYERKQEKDYVRSKNFLYVMEAFTNRVDEFSAGGDTPPDNVTVPYWMADAIAKGFSLYQTNLLQGDRNDLNLDLCFHLDADKKNDYDLFTVTAEKVLNDAYEIQWLFGVSREIAIEAAHAMIDLKLEGKAHFRCTVDSVIYLAKCRKDLPTLKGWQEQTGRTYIATEDQRREYQELLDAYSALDKDGGVFLKLQAAILKKRKSVN
jgi:hypothetical protein